MGPVLPPNFFILADDTSLMDLHSNLENLKLNYYLDVNCKAHWLEQNSFKIGRHLETGKNLTYSKPKVYPTG